MTKKRKLLITGGLLIISQIFLFQDYISPFQWGQIKVRGQACTCPDGKVVNGQLYLESITPDSLKKNKLDYSEIYVSERPTTDFDPMGVDLYIIRGKVVGKDRISESDPWNPLVEIESWREVDMLLDWSIKGLILVELLILGFLLFKNTKPRTRIG